MVGAVAGGGLSFCQKSEKDKFVELMAPGNFQLVSKTIHNLFEI